MPSARSALGRTSAVETPGLGFDWRVFAERQLVRAGRASLPYAIPWSGSAAFGALAVAAALSLAAFARRYRALWAALALFGFFWALPMRAYSFGHYRDFEALFYVGVPLALFALALMRARALWGERIIAAAAVAAAIVFAVSAFQMGRLDENPDKAEIRKAEMADYDAIREKTRGKTAAVYPEVGEGRDFDGNLLEFYLAGTVLAEGEKPPTFPQMGRADFVVSRQRDFNGFAPLTPENRHIFLHAAPTDPADWFRAARRRAESAEPAARSGFDLYLVGGALYYIKDPCAEEDRRGRFFLSVHPVHAGHLPQDRRALGHDSLNFGFDKRGTPVFDGACMAKRLLPAYPIRAIETGQWTPGEGEIWRAVAHPPLGEKSIARYETLYQAVKSSGEPLIRSGFDIYLKSGALTYLKEPCAREDASGRFFLSVHPVRVEDLPENRRELGHDGLNFDFSPDGVAFGEKCMITRELPGYEIAKIVTGQDAPSGERLWSGEAAISGAD